MAQRTVALCDGEYIGIESIFTVIHGRQINIPEKVEALREKSRRNQLFCPCGCGANLTLVAGDRNLREQHFRLRDGEQGQNCRFVTEGKCSVDSKIVLKCWLDDKLKDAGIQSRVPINAIDDTNRKYEFTLLSRKNALAVSYSYERANLSDEKFDILESNSRDIRIIYIVDAQNGGVSGQYPESLMKIQTRQGYCLYLSVEDIDYYKAELKAVFFIQDIDGLWQEISFAADKLSKFKIDDKGRLIHEGRQLEELIKEAMVTFVKEQEALKLKRKEAAERAGRLKQFSAKEEWEQEEQRKQAEARLKKWERQQAEAERRRREWAEKQRIEQKKKEQERCEKNAAFQAMLEKDFAEIQDRQIRDEKGERWIQCEFCGKKYNESKFISYGGPGKMNLGTCKECAKNNPAVYEKGMQHSETPKRKYDPDICPECGGRLREKTGKFGPFMGCSNYPKCKYTGRIIGNHVKLFSKR